LPAHYILRIRVSMGLKSERAAVDIEGALTNDYALDAISCVAALSSVGAWP
jgi:hypothetical protein